MNTEICENPVKYGCINGQHSCSPIFSQSNIGDYCRSMLAKMSKSASDTLIENYCIKNENAEECKCINRSTNPDYIRLKNHGNIYPDACWYTPCLNKMHYFVTSRFDEPVSCPANICQEVYNISKTADINLDNLKHEINCDFSNGGVIPSSYNGGVELPTWLYVATLIVVLAFIMVFALKRRR